jgi:peptidoglycan/LPS O-acetylase OafA/YrhL
MLGRMLGPTASRVPGLDGLRAISISFVLLGHLVGTRGADFIPGVLGRLAGFGVGVFFIISGYLITSILLSELKKSGTISLRRFYFRRTLRLFPAALAYLSVIAILGAAGLVELLEGDLWHALTYTMNFHHPRAWLVGHLWSLSVEEQFYLIWPAALVALGTLAGARTALIGVIVSAPILRIALWLVSPAQSVHADEFFFTVADSLATGCLIAVLRSQLSDNPAYRRFIESRWVILCPILAVALAYNPFVLVDWLFGRSLMNLCLAIVVDWATRSPSTPVGRLLNWAPLTAMGVLSYSLYLWQQPFLNRNSDAWFCAFPANILLAFLAATASYLLVERPSLVFRERIEPRLFGPVVPRSALPSVSQAPVKGGGSPVPEPQNTISFG